MTNNKLQSCTFVSGVWWSFCSVVGGASAGESTRTVDGIINTNQ